MPGNSNDPPPQPPGQFRFGYDGKAPPAKRNKSEMELMDEEYEKLDKADKAAKAKAKPKPKATLIKQKDKKKDPPVGLKKETIVPDHDQKLTKHGVKPVVHKNKKEEDKPIPHVDVKITEYGGKQWKRKGAPPPPQTTILRKRPIESGPPTKKSRRVSAHAI